MKTLLIFMVSVLAISFSAMADVDSLSESNTKLDANDVKPPKYYTGLTLGMEGYPEVENIDKGYNIAIQGGYYMKENIMLEAGLGLAKSQLISTNLLVAGRTDTFNIDQYQLVGAAKYSFNPLFGTGIIPVIGTAISYTYRSYNLLNGLATGNSGKTGNSSALDAGLAASLEYAFNKKYSAGMDLKYMFNLSNQVNSSYSKPTYGYNGVTLESLQYYVAGLSARMNF